MLFNIKYSKIINFKKIKINQYQILCLVTPFPIINRTKEPTIATINDV